KSRTLIPSSTFINCFSLSMSPYVRITKCSGLYGVEFALQSFSHGEQARTQFSGYASPRNGAAGAYARQYKWRVSFQQYRSGQRAEFRFPLADGHAIPGFGDLRHALPYAAPQPAPFPRLPALYVLQQIVAFKLRQACQQRPAHRRLCNSYTYAYMQGERHRRIRTATAFQHD